MDELLGRLTVSTLPPAFKAGVFDCGEPEVDEYLCDGDAAEDEAAGVTRTYLIRDGEELVGYVSVLCDAIRLNRDERPTAYGVAPALKVGRMGVRKSHQGRDVGSWILDWVVGLARSLARQAGLRYVTLDSLPKESLVRWYSAYGFKKNIGEERARKIVKQKGLRHTRLEDIELPHVSMRFDILLKEEVAGAAQSTPQT